jgi:hypothetical protein
VAIYNLEKKEQELLKLFCEVGPLHGYAIFKSPYQLMASSHWNKIKKKLENLGLIENKGKKPASKLRGRTKILYGLTFKGLLYSIDNELITSVEASKSRIKNKIKLPKEGFGPPQSFDYSENEEFLKEIGIEVDFTQIHEKPPIPEEIFTTNKEWFKIREEIESKYSEEIYSRFLSNVNLNRYNETIVRKRFYESMYYQIFLLKTKEKKYFFTKYPSMKKISKKMVKAMQQGIKIY